VGRTARHLAGANILCPQHCRDASLAAKSSALANSFITDVRGGLRRLCSGTFKYGEDIGQSFVEHDASSEFALGQPRSLTTISDQFAKAFQFRFGT
jgi:hypothetical protein